MISVPVGLLSTLESCENVTLDAAILSPARQSVSVTSRTRPAFVSKYEIRHEPSFYCSSSVKSKSTWLCVAEFKFEVKRKRRFLFKKN